MKRSLGKALFVAAAFAASAMADAYVWSIVDAPKTLHVGETGTVRYQCAFTTSAADYTIDFKPRDTETYGARILTQTDRIVKGKRLQTFDVQLIPRRPGPLAVKLDALVRHTTFASIENATIGRDNVKRYDFNDVNVTLPPVKIDAQENRAGLIGEIALESSVDSNMVRAHEPVHLSLYVRGKGNLENFVPYELNISGVRVFAEPPQKNLSLTREGSEGEIRQEFALVSDKSFTIPPFRMEIYNTATQRYETPGTRPIAIDVAEGYAPSNLLDPPDLSDTATLRQYGLYGALIVLGMVLGEAVRRVWRRLPKREAKAFWNGAKSQKELSVLLALSGEKRYEPIIRSLERGEIGLGEAKKKLEKIG